MLVTILLVLAGAAGAQPPKGTALDQAYDEVLAAQKVLQQAEGARDDGVEPLPGERLGTAGGHSRLGPNYEARQVRLQEQVEQARKRLDQALERWNSLR